MTERIHELFTRQPEVCDGCGVAIPIGARAFIRTDGVIFHDLACEANHPDAKPPTFVVDAQKGSGF